MTEIQVRQDALLSRLSAGSNTRTARSHAFAGLVRSVREQGVLQPLLVRPVDDDDRVEHDFEIVCGHRRALAAVAAGLERVPVVVRHMTDAEVQEAQLVENGQREGIHPLDEARAIEALYAIHNDWRRVGDRLGRSASYVRRRAELVVLSKRMQKRFLDGEFDVTSALLIATLPSSEAQERCFKAVFEARWNGPGDADDVKQWLEENARRDLAKASFDTADASLFPVAGACTVCPKRAGAQKLLFVDVKLADTCTDPTCYREKQDAHWKRVRAAAKKNKTKTLKVSEAKDTFLTHGDGTKYSSPLVSLREKVYVGSKRKSYDQALGKRARDEGRVTLAQNPVTHEVEELVDQKWAKAIVEKPLKGSPPSVSNRAAKEAAKTREERRLRKLAARRNRAVYAAALEKLKRNDLPTEFHAGVSHNDVLLGFLIRLLARTHRYGLDSLTRPFTVDGKVPANEKPKSFKDVFRVKDWEGNADRFVLRYLGEGWKLGSLVELFVRLLLENYSALDRPATPGQLDTEIAWLAGQLQVNVPEALEAIDLEEAAYQARKEKERKRKKAAARRKKAKSKGTARSSNRRGGKGARKDRADVAPTAGA